MVTATGTSLRKERRKRVSRVFTKFAHAIEHGMILLNHHGQDVQVETWQGADVSEDPSFATREVMDFRMRFFIPRHSWVADELIRPDQPWADEHFKERVSGFPMNPGAAYRDWPWHAADPNRFLDPTGHFDVSYMERLWPPPDVSIRFGSGNLRDVVRQLAKEPYTRKAYIPLFFPEDTGRDGRTMCSLEHHFLRRNDRLHLWYDLRSCDIVRHFANDVYFACRLCQWMVAELEEADESWGVVQPGTLFFSAHSFHYHKGDYHHYRALPEKHPKVS
jgi:hypothetical protein